ERSGHADRKGQESADFDRRAEKFFERTTSGILEHQHDMPVLAHELQRPRRPSAAQLLLQREFVGEPFKHQGCGVLGTWKYQQDGWLTRTLLLISVEDTFAVLPGNAEVGFHRAEPRQAHRVAPKGADLSTSLDR